MDRSRLLPWIVRAVWASLPFVVGPALAGALDGRSVAVRSALSVLAWAVWGGVLCATLVLHPVSLTALRIAAPAAVATAAWTLTQDAGASAVVAVVAAVVAAVLAFLPEVGVAFVNGPAYPNERRYPLRPPGALLLGPLALAWVVTAGAPVAAVALLAARQWILGGIAVVVAAAAVAILGRALHGMARRWVVFVPAGIVLHDPMTLADPVLFRKESVGGLHVAPADTTALDMTQRAPGLALELDLTEEATLVMAKPGQRIGPSEVTTALLFTPTRPGRVLEEATARRLAS